MLTAEAEDRHKWLVRKRIQPSRALAEYVRCHDYHEIAARSGGIRPFAVALFPSLTFYLGVRGEAFEYSTRRTRVLPRVIALGPCDHRVADLIDTGHNRNFTVVFEPTGFFRLFHLSPAEILNYAYDCRDVLGEDIAGLHDRLCETSEPQEMVRIVEAVLLQRLATASPRSAMQRAAGMLFHDPGISNLSVVASSLGLSDRSWRRHFVSEIGVTPKRYLRMLRFRRAVSLKRESPDLSWTRVCLEAGYYDQSHFIAEFREMGGAAPSEFMREFDAVPDHIMTSPG